jgi:hypothetical protein
MWTIQGPLMKNVILASAATLLMCASTVYAADFGAADPYSPPQTPASAILEGGLWLSNVNQTDDTINQFFVGGYGALAASFMIAPQFMLMGDAQAEARGTSTFDEAPRTVIVLGGHALYTMGVGAIGVFAGTGTVDMDGDWPWGSIYGVEGTFNVGQTMFLGQVGHANIQPSPGDEAFIGWIARVGALHSMSPDKAVLVDLGFGHSPNIFEDSGDWGTYFSWGVKFVKHVPQFQNMFLTLAYDGMSVTANTEDSGIEHSIRVGLAIPLGGATTAAEVARPLATPMGPFRAAGWAGTLD